MSDYDAPQFGLGPGLNAFDWRALPAVVPAPEPLTREEKNRIWNRESYRAKRAKMLADLATTKTAPAAPAVPAVPSKWNKAQLVPATLGNTAFNVPIASQAASDRTNSIGRRP